MRRRRRKKVPNPPRTRRTASRRKALNELSGFSRVACLATVEEGGESQILISGTCVSDNQLYFDVMLDLFKQEFPEISGSPELMVFSDEDLSFLNAVSAKLPQAKRFICLYVLRVS